MVLPEGEELRTDTLADDGSVISTSEGGFARNYREGTFSSEGNNELEWYHESVDSLSVTTHRFGGQTSNEEIHAPDFPPPPLDSHWLGSAWWVEQTVWRSLRRRDPDGTSHFITSHWIKAEQEAGFYKFREDDERVLLEYGTTYGGLMITQSRSTLWPRSGC